MQNWRPLLVVFLLLALLLTGCWNRRDPELLGFVIATGFDLHPETGLYQIIVQVANPLVLGSQDQGSGGGGEKKPFWVVEAQGHTPFEARQNLALKTSRELFWAHNGILALGENLAREGIAPVLDLFELERQLRLSARPVVVDGDLRSLFEAEFPLEETSGQGLRRQIVTTMFERTFFSAREIRELIATLSRPGFEMMISRIEERATGEQGDSTGATHPAKLSGGAAFGKDRMVGWIEEREAAGWNWIWWRTYRASLVVMAPTDRRPLVVEIFRSRSIIKPRVEGDNVTIDIQIEAQGRVQDQPSTDDLFTVKERLASLERRTATVIKNDVDMVIRRAQELESDFLGFGNLIYRKLPREWKRLEPRWQEIFPNLKVNVDVRVVIQRGGLVVRPQS
ncbi:MAG: Ger(x)C family spore germination protein [bacterium]